MHKLKYFLSRIIQLIPMMLFATFITYMLMELAPGDNVALMWVNPKQMRATPEVLQAIKEKFGLNGPWYVRYFQWLRQLLQGNMGYSLISMRPVSWEISHRIGPSILLIFISQIVTYGTGIILGVLAAVKQNKLADRVISTINYITMSLPSTWTNLMILLIFTVKLKWFPSMGLHDLTLKNPNGWEYVMDTVKHMVLPVLCMSIISFGNVARLMRGSFLEVKNQDYVRTARAKGVSERNINWHHVFRNSSLLVVSNFAATLPTLILQTTLIETVFGIPGLGGYVATAAINRDYPAAMISILLTALLSMTGTILADFTMTLIDPRISFSRKRWK